MVSIYDGGPGDPISTSFSCKGLGIGLWCVKMIRQPASTFSVQGMVLDLGLPLVTDRKLKLCCSFYSFESLVSKVVCRANSTKKLLPLASQEGAGCGDEARRVVRISKLKAKVWKRQWDPLVPISCLS